MQECNAYLRLQETAEHLVLRPNFSMYAMAQKRGSCGEHHRDRKSQEKRLIADRVHQCVCRFLDFRSGKRGRSRREGTVMPVIGFLGSGSPARQSVMRTRCRKRSCGGQHVGKKRSFLAQSDPFAV